MKNIGKIIVLSVIILIVLIALLTGANILFFWSIFGFVEKTVSSVTGLDSNLAHAVAALGVALFVILPLGRMVKSFSPLPQENKGAYRSLVFLGIGFIFFLAYLGEKNAYFDPQTGAPMKYYSESPEGGYNFFSEDGFDPVTGDKLKPVTKEIILKSKGLYRERVVEDVELRQPYQQPVVQQHAPPPPLEEKTEQEEEYISPQERAFLEETNSRVPIEVRNWHQERIVINGVNNDDSFSVPARAFLTLKLMPGRYQAYRNGLVEREFTVQEDGAPTFIFGEINESPSRKSKEITDFESLPEPGSLTPVKRTPVEINESPSRKSKEITDFESLPEPGSLTPVKRTPVEIKKGSFTCDNYSYLPVYLCDVNNQTVYTVEQYQKASTKVAVGNYVVRHGQRTQSICISETRSYEFIIQPRSYSFKYRQILY